jgi:predicted ferric reductase
MSNSILWYATRGAGLVSMIMLTGVVVLGITAVMRVQSSAWPRFLTAGLHRNLALLSVVFLAIHIVTAVVDPFTALGWQSALIPFSSYYRTFWLGLGAVGLYLMAALVVTSLMRARLGHRTWRAVHWLAYACWTIAMLHSLGTGTDTQFLWDRVLAVACAAAVGAAITWRWQAGTRRQVQRWYAPTWDTG